MLVLLISQYNLVRSYYNVCVNGIRQEHCESILTLVKVTSNQQFLTRTCVIDCQQVIIEEHWRIKKQSLKQFDNTVVNKFLAKFWDSPLVTTAFSAT